jgi:cyclopropane-fatty-acyl-phospholipid synthase
MKKLVINAFDEADIKINGSRPWDICVKDDRFYSKIARSGATGLGESYVDGWWNCHSLDQCIYKLAEARLDEEVNLLTLVKRLEAKVLNLQSIKRAKKSIHHHYDIGNDLFQKMLDRRMIYSCAYWRNASNLDEAQEAKLDLICRKLELKPNMRLLDVGCGWGGLARFAAEKYGVHVTGITISEEQASFAKQTLASLPIEIRLQDYRDLKNESFDRIVSVGMFEHVGYKNYRPFFQAVERVLKDDGLFLLHTMGNLNTVKRMGEWIDQYIFPDYLLPSLEQVLQASHSLFVLEDLHNFGADYDKTLMAWAKNFNAHWGELKSTYDDRFHRIWNFYLHYVAGSFRSRRVQLWQLVLSKRGILGGYHSIR